MEHVVKNTPGVQEVEHVREEHPVAPPRVCDPTTPWRSVLDVDLHKRRDLAEAVPLDLGNFGRRREG